MHPGTNPPSRTEARTDLVPDDQRIEGVGQTGIGLERKGHGGRYGMKAGAAMRRGHPLASLVPTRRQRHRLAQMAGR